MLAIVPLMVMQPNPATTPISRMSESWWKARHEACVEMTKQGGFDIAFLGDSITQGWESVGKAYWDKNFAPMKSANFGFSGDRTEHVLWRLDNGEILAAKPKVIVIMIGTNNIGHRSVTPAQASEGVRAIVAKIRAGSPESRVLLLATFPRSTGPQDADRLKVAEMVDAYKSVADGKSVWFLDIRVNFVNGAGYILPAIMPDYLHLSPAGYQIWGDAMLPTLKSALAQ